MLGSVHHAATALRKATSVVVCGHVRPDGDAIGSTLALTLALRSVGIPAVPTSADPEGPPQTYNWLPGFGLYASAADLATPDVFVALDTPHPDRLGQSAQMARDAAVLIVVDHHPDATEYGSVNVLEPSAAATGQLVWALCDALGAPRTEDVALGCYTALLTDTGRFSYQNTSPAALRDAAAMLDTGVDPALVALRAYQNRSAASLALEARAMSRLTLANDGHVAYAWVTDEDFAELGARPEDAEHLPDAVRVVEDIEVALVLREHGAEVRGNLRAKTSFDVGAVARSLGGGGHTAAAGFTVTETSVREVIGKILPVLPGGVTR